MAGEGLWAGARLPIAIASGLATGVLSGVLYLHVDGAEASGGGDDARDGDEGAAARAGDGEATTGAGASGAPDAAIPAAGDAGMAARIAADAGVEEEPDADDPDDEDEELVASENDSGNGADVAPRSATLHFRLDPADASGVSIYVDGEEVTGRAHEVELEGGRARVQARVRARGFLPWAQTITVRGDRRVAVELQRPEPSDDGPGGRIDL